MKMTDETLSAFLDDELTPGEMEAVRDQLAMDPTLTDRLAELASVDDELRKHYRSIDALPMPESVNRRLMDHNEGKNPPATNSNVVDFFQRRPWQEHGGKAIAALFIAGAVLMQWTVKSTNSDPSWQAVAKVLDSEPSGEVYSLGSERTVLPRLTFRNQADEWCRQYRVVSESTAAEGIACRSDSGAWNPVEQVSVTLHTETSRYQTASGGSVMDKTLDDMMAGPPIGSDREKALLRRQWRQ